MKWSTYCHEKTAPLVKGVEDGADQNPRSFLAVPIPLKSMPHNTSYSSSVKTWLSLDHQISSS
jgi:hypothetical protein